MRLMILLLIVLLSCKQSEVVTQPKLNRDTTRTYNPEIDLSKLSLFERALFNSWDEMTEEQKTFFKQCLIGSDSLKIK